MWVGRWRICFDRTQFEKHLSWPRKQAEDPSVAQLHILTPASLWGVLVAATEVEIPEFLDGFPKGKRLKKLLMCLKCIQMCICIYIIIYICTYYIHYEYWYTYIYILHTDHIRIIDLQSTFHLISLPNRLGMGRAKLLRFWLDPVTSSPHVDVAGDISCWLSHEKVYYASNLHLRSEEIIRHHNLLEAIRHFTYVFSLFSILFCISLYCWIIAPSRRSQCGQKEKWVKERRLIYDPNARLSGSLSTVTVAVTLWTNSYL